MRARSIHQYLVSSPCSYMSGNPTAPSVKHKSNSEFFEHLLKAHFLNQKSSVSLQDSQVTIIMVTHGNTFWLARSFLGNELIQIQD